MRKFTTTFLALLTVAVVFGQIEKHADWKEPFLSEKSPKVGDIVEFVYKVDIDEGWYLYSCDFEPDIGPIVTTFEYDGSQGFELIGDPIAVNPKSTYDDIFEMTYTYFEPKGEFRQKIKVTNTKMLLKVKIDYQTCQHEGKCINSKQKFELNFSASPAPVNSTASKEDDSPENPKVNIKNRIEDTFVYEEDGIGRNKEGIHYVKHNNKWLQVPKENSPEFYKKYLSLGGNHEE